MKKSNNKGFTLAELLVVVAIIAVLVAIFIPIFTNQLEKSREATDVADARDFYAEIATALVSGELNAEHTTIQVGSAKYATATYKDGALVSVTVADWTAHQKVTNWQTGAQVIANVTIAQDNDWAGKTGITYVFSQDTENDDYLSNITVGTPTTSGGSGT